MRVKNYDSFLEVNEHNGSPKSKKSNKYTIFVESELSLVIREVLSNLRSTDIYEKISDIFLSSYPRKWVTMISYISLSDKNDELSFIPVSKLDQPNYYNDRLYDKEYYPGRQSAKVGRIIRKIIEDNGDEVIHSELEMFVNFFKEKWEASRTNLNIKVVEGVAIKKWYFNGNYSKMTLNGSGSLGKSCMSGIVQQNFLKIYEDNPDTIKMIIQTDDDGRLLSRALFWKLDNSITNSKFYLDRVYYTSDHQNGLIREWFLKNIDNSGRCYGGRDKLPPMTITLKKWKYPLYPYMDSLYYLNDKTGQISNFRVNVDEKKVPILSLRGLHGKASSDNWVYSKVENRWIRRTHSIYDDSKESYVTSNRRKFISYFDDILSRGPF